VLESGVINHALQINYSRNGGDSCAAGIKVCGTLPKDFQIELISGVTLNESLLVNSRGRSLEIAELAMRCDSKEIPSDISGLVPTGSWIAMQATFGGSASKLNLEGTAIAPEDIVAKGTVAMAVFDDRVIGILSPEASSEPSLWFAWTLAPLEVTTVGTQGAFKKRPGKVRIDQGGGVDVDGNTLVLGSVSLIRASGQAQSGQEQSLFDSLVRR
jgi:hypothetical protein